MYPFLLPITMRHALSRSSGIGQYYNLLYNLWPELSALGLQRFCRLTCDTRGGCYWKGDVIFFCALDVFIIQDAHYGGSFSSSEDLIGRLFKIVPHHQDSWLPVSDVPKQHPFSAMMIDSGFVPLWSYSLLLNILCGCHWIPITFLSCLLWNENCSVFSGHPLTHPRFQLQQCTFY